MRSGEVDLPSESRTGGFYLGIAVWAVNTPIALRSLLSSPRGIHISATKPRTDPAYRSHRTAPTGSREKRALRWSISLACLVLPSHQRQDRSQ